MNIPTFLKRITPSFVIRRSLAESQLKRLDYQDQAAFAIKMSEYHDGRIERLERERSKLLAVA